MADTALDQLIKIGQSSGGRNPSQESEYQRLLSAGERPSTGITGDSGGMAGDVVGQARNINQYLVEQNKPVVAAYEASKTPLQERYKGLLESIQSGQKTAENRQTVSTQSELGRRGIFTESGVGQQEMVNALNPITSQYTGMLKDVGSQQNIDIANIDKAIASLMAGNPESALSTASGLAQMQESARQFQQGQESTQRQRDVENALAQLKLTLGGDKYMTLGEGQTLFDPATGKPVYTAPKTYKSDSSDPLGL